MYAAATSGCFDFDVTANGMLSPPSDTGSPPASAGGASMKPTRSPMRFSRSATSHVPAIRNVPLPRANCCHAGS